MNRLKHKSRRLGLQGYEGISTTGPHLQAKVLDRPEFDVVCAGAVRR